MKVKSTLQTQQNTSVPLAKTLVVGNELLTRDIYQHSNGVFLLAEKLLSSYDFSDAYLKDQKVVLKYSTLLHDIGKVTEKFQAQLKQNVDIDSIKAIATHAQIGASFVLMHLKLKDGINIERLMNIVSNIYWHHGMQPWQHKSNINFNLQTIYKEISSEDKAVMIEVAKKLVGDNVISDKPNNSNLISYDLPNYFDLKMSNNNNTSIDGLDKLNIVTRSLLVLADRLYSKYEFDNKTVTQIHQLYNKSNQIHKETIKSEYPRFDKKRLSEQKKIAKHKGTLFINAPTGNGKTMIGYLFANNNKKKAIWVNPNNVISTSVYNNLIDLTEKLGTKHTIALLLGSEIIASNYDASDENITPDITVTNIDNFFAPTTKNNLNNEFFSLFSSDKTIIFDEYHNLIAESAYFSLFVYLVRTRTNIIKNTDTMLLSATHSGLIDIIFSPKAKIKPYTILPKPSEHYKASHTQPYLMNLLEVDNITDIKVDKGEIFFINTVSETQNAYLASTKEDYNKNAIIYHSKFTNTDRKKLYNQLVDTFGYKHKAKPKKKSVYASLIAQTSIDISFNKIYDTVFSIESTFQRMGRCNRWGEYDMSCVDIINTTNSKTNKSNDGLVKLIYSTELRLLWIKYIRENISGKLLTLDELYVHYNKFYKLKEVISENEKWIVKTDGNTNKGVLNTSLSYLLNVYPKRMPNNISFDTDKSKPNKYNANNQVIRLTGFLHFFYTCEHDSTENIVGRPKYVNEVFSGELYGNDFSELKEPENMAQILINAGKYFRTHKEYYSNYDYTDAHVSQHNNRLLEYWFKSGVYSTTPYILHKVVYNSILGIIDRKDRGLK